MSNEPERFFDITAEMQSKAEQWCKEKVRKSLEDIGLIVGQYANRLNAAYDREYCEFGGDSAALRKVVNEALDTVKALSKSYTSHNVDLPEDVRAMLGMLAFNAQSTFAAKPRACDLMSEEDLTKVATNGIVSSVLEMPDLKYIGEGIRKLIGAIVMGAVASAIKCAYDTQLVSKKEEETP